MVYLATAQALTRRADHALLSRFGCLPRVLGATFPELRHVAPESVARTVRLFAEAMRRVLALRFKPRPQLGSWSAVHDYLSAALVSIETTLELWTSSLRKVKARMPPLFAQERGGLRAYSWTGRSAKSDTRQGGCSRGRRGESWALAPADGAGTGSLGCRRPA
jgi:hypothetical protein